jgi:aminoglycoside N3'-acetyltransferase
MLRVTLEQVVPVLRGLGLAQGDGALVHSALQYLGQPEGGVEMYLQAFDEVLGLGIEPTGYIPLCRGEVVPRPYPTTPLGTLAAPAFNFAFARGERYHPQETPSVGMGAFAECVRQHPQALRTPHPMQSLAVIGQYAAGLAGRDTASAFDPGSAFERMLELDFWLVLLGATVQAASIIHWSEQRFLVPYRYWKDFRGEVWNGSAWETRTYRMYARDLELDPQLDLTPVQACLEARGQWHSVKLNYGHISACRLQHFAQAADDLLAQDPWVLVQLGENGKSI